MTASHYPTSAASGAVRMHDDARMAYHNDPSVAHRRAGRTTDGLRDAAANRRVSSSSAVRRGVEQEIDLPVVLRQCRGGDPVGPYVLHPRLHDRLDVGPEVGQREEEGRAVLHVIREGGGGQPGLLENRDGLTGRSGDRWEDDPVGGDDVLRLPSAQECYPLGGSLDVLRLLDNRVPSPLYSDWLVPLGPTGVGTMPTLTSSLAKVVNIHAP